MHKIAAKEFTLEDFSCERLLNVPARENGYIPLSILKATIEALNNFRDLYNEMPSKTYWYQLIQLLPSSYNQRRTIFLNYEVLANMYHSRKNHKLDEWRTFCNWIETLPFSELITGGKDGNE